MHIMAQQNEPNHSLDPATAPVKRKRGRPRKEDVPGTESGGRTQRRRRNPPPTMGQGLVGQPVSGILDGVFDAGFLISVRVSNNGPLLRGMVFDSRLSVPISPANDVAPHIKMSKREDIPIPAISAEPLQRRGPTVSTPIRNKGVPSDGSHRSALRSKGSEDVNSRKHSTVPKEVVPSTVLKEVAPSTVLVPDIQRQGLTGTETVVEPKLGSTSQTYPGNEAAGERKRGFASQTHPGNEAAGEPKLGFVSQTTQGNEMMGEHKLCSTSQTTPGAETAGELKLGSTSQTTPGTETAVELKLGSTSQRFLGIETAGELKLDSEGQIPPANESTGQPKFDSLGQISPQPHIPSPLSEPDSKEVKSPKDSEQVKSSAAGTESMTSHAGSEVLQEIHTNPVGNGNSEMPSSGAF